MDKDRNGVISFSEFSSRTEKMFTFLDKNSDGNITRQEMDGDENLRKELSRNISRMGLPNASSDIVEIIKKHFNDEP